MPIVICVRMFGSVREAAGHGAKQFTLADGATLSALRAQVEREVPALAALGEKVRVAVNMEVVRARDAKLCDGDEVAFLPPVAGGAGARATLSPAPLDVGAVVARVAGADAGGIVTFVGAVRAQSRGREIRHLEYEAYAGMAEREMERICDEAAARFAGARVALAHRSGRLEVGALAVVVAAAAPHRAEAFAACRYAIDTLKERVPIWKKEVATDGEYWVEETP